jgi:predicted neuraminidase
MRVLLFIFLACVFTPLLLQFSAPKQRLFFSVDEKIEAPKPVANSQPLPATYRQQFASSGATPEVHSAVQVSLSNGNMRAFWYGGKREGAKDVSIYSAELDLLTNEWRDERVVVERHDISRQLGIYLRKIGNPVAMRDDNGRIWLFFVTVSVGGWAGSSINFIISEDEGLSWSQPTRLMTSPLLNLSTLVKGEPFLYRDGSIGLPVYHELMGKFGELLYVSSNGQVLDKQRLTSGRKSLQPIILPRDEGSALVYMRNATDLADSTLFETSTNDGGRSWSKATLSDLPNPNAAVSGLRLNSGALLLVGNNQHDKRNNLSLLFSDNNGQKWHLLREFEQENNTPDVEHEFAYPALRKSADGEFHVLYTWNKKRIKHIRFNSQWLRERVESL